jgi:hypothetical protein
MEEISGHSYFCMFEIYLPSAILVSSSKSSRLSLAQTAAGVGGTSNGDELEEKIV